MGGLNAIHVGDNYENATQKNRSRVPSSRIDFPIDVLAWSTSDNIDEVLYLAQCVVAGKGQTIIGKINDMVSVSEEVNSILSTHTNKPHIYSAILTRMKKDDLNYEFKEAEERLVKIVTVEDLVYLLQAIRNHDLALSSEIYKILTIQLTKGEQDKESIQELYWTNEYP